jgi:pimeloyl-ACP methyl ester carboxylesterase
MTWHVLERDGAKLAGFDGGEGTPLVFQHGLGGDEAQVAEALTAINRRRLTLECRAHGRSEAGDPEHFTISTFANDVLAFADARKIDRFAIGGISMGAAISLRLAVKHPQRISALILARPAWLWGARPENMAVIAEAAEYIRDGRLDDFLATRTAEMLKDQAPDNLATLARFFERPNSQQFAKLLEAIAADGPGIGEADVRSIQVPTLILATELDWIHPLSHATTLAAMIPNAKLVELTPKSVDKQRHLLEFSAATRSFLKQAGL